MEDERPSPELNEDDASILAMLFGLHLGYTTVTPYKLFALDNAERVSCLVDEEMKLPSSIGKRRVAVHRQVQSREFKKLSPEALEAYRSEAQRETEKNKHYAEAPISNEETFRCVFLPVLSQ